MKRHEPAVTPWPPGSRAPHNLPAPLTSLVGRQPELDQIAALLARDRLVTLVGAAGIGKTRLGVHSAAAALDDHPDGAWFVDLSLVTQPHLVIHAVASALGVRERAGETLLQTVDTFVAGKVLLLVLDNCEHLTHACAELVCRLQRATSDLHVLATSRKELGVVGEVAWVVPPLAPPAGESPEEVASNDAARLFVARAGEDLEVTGVIAAAIARICRRLDGIPLAIELAAGRVGELTPQEIETNLEHRFHLLTTDREDVSERQRSFHATLEWSHDLLSEPERVLLRRLATFAGPFTVNEADRVCSLDRVGGDGVAGVVARLARMSLLARRAGGDHVRYRMHESVRHFALEKLEAAGEHGEVRRGHARWCIAMAERADSDPAGQEQAECMVELADARSELRGALAWTVDHEPVLALALAGSLTRFWVACGELDEGRAWLERALAAGGDASGARAKALWGSGLVSCLLGDFGAVGPALGEGMALARGAGDGAVLARLLNLVGVTRIFTDPPGALEVLAETIVLSRRHDETTTLVSALAMQGFARALCGDLDAAAESLQECLDDGSGFGDSQPLVMGLVGMGHVRLHQGDTAGARTCLDEGLAMARRVHNPIWVALALGYQADLEAAFGSHHQARRLAGEAVEVARLTGALPVIGLCLAMAGNVELAAGNPASSLPLFDEALQRVTGERGGVRSRALVGRGRALVDLGDPEAALALLQEAVALAEDVRNRIAAAAALHELGRCAARLGDHGSALERYRASLTANSLAGHRMAVPGSLEAIACETAHVGDVIRALRLAAAADAIRARTGMARSGEDEVNYETVAALADKVLEPDVQAAAIDAGGQLTAEQLVPYACARPMSLSIYAGGRGRIVRS